MDNNKNTDPDYPIQEDLAYSETYPNEQLPNLDQINSMPQDSHSTKQINFNNNYLEISLQAKYFNTIKFIKFLQRYETTIIPLCINIGTSSYQQNESEQNKNGTMNSKFIINIPTQEE